MDISGTIVSDFREPIHDDYLSSELQEVAVLPVYHNPVRKGYRHDATNDRLCAVTKEYSVLG
jgi:hypothetical protein